MKANETSSAVYDLKTNAVVTTFIGFLSVDEFKVIGSQQLDIIETRRLKKALNDIQGMKVLKPEVQEWVNTVWFAKAQKAGLRFMAFVVPNDIFGKMSMDGANRNAKDTFGIEIQYFNSVDNAKNWLTSKN